MTRKQLQRLISAGVFSVSLLNGVAYAKDIVSKPETAPTQESKSDDSSTKKASTEKEAAGTSTSDASTQDSKHTEKTDKESAKNGCGGANGCGGH